MYTINMRNNLQYVVWALIPVFAIAMFSFGSASLAQTSSLTCTASPTTLGVNQTSVITANGGNGTYSWTTGSMTGTTSPAGNQITVSYSQPGTYGVTVASGNSVANCTLVVVGSPAVPTSTTPTTPTTTPPAPTPGLPNTGTPTLACAPASQNVILGQTAFMTASGGTGSYLWSAPGLNILNPTGSGFSANYAVTGLHTVTVTSGGQVANCAVNVLASGTTPTPPTTPGLPNTGGGFGH